MGMMMSVMVRVPSANERLGYRGRTVMYSVVSGEECWLTAACTSVGMKCGPLEDGYAGFMWRSCVMGGI